jgi:hypothetical protein
MRRSEWVGRTVLVGSRVCYFRIVGVCVGKFGNRRLVEGVIGSCEESFSGEGVCFLEEFFDVFGDEVAFGVEV